MITSHDCREELEKAKRIVKTEEGKALLKIGEINNKVLLNVRLILSKVMEALKIPKIETKLRDYKKDDKMVSHSGSTHYVDPNVKNVEDK